MVSPSTNPSHWSGEPETCLRWKKSLAKAGVSRLNIFLGRCHDYPAATAAQEERDCRERVGEKKKRGFRIEFAEGSSWNIHHSMLFFWDPTAVSGGAGVGERKTRSLVTERWNSNTAWREMAGIQQQKLSSCSGVLGSSMNFNHSTGWN